MRQEISVELLTADDWARYRDIRLRALVFDGDAFGGSLDVEEKFAESEWRSKANQYVGLVAALGGLDIGFMTVENLVGDFGATCWVGSCWVDPQHRGKGALSSLFAFTDAHAQEREWSIQGLGVWVDNENAIAAYEKLGFVRKGEPQESSRKAGMYYQRMIRVTR